MKDNKLMTRYNKDPDKFLPLFENFGFIYKSTNADGNALWYAPDDTPGDVSLTIKPNDNGKYNIHVHTGHAEPLKQGGDYSFSDARMALENIDEDELYKRLAQEYGDTPAQPGNGGQRKENPLSSLRSPKPKPPEKPQESYFPEVVTLDEDRLVFIWKLDRKQRELKQDPKIPDVYVGKADSVLPESFGYIYYDSNDKPEFLVLRVLEIGRDTKKVCLYHYDSKDGKFRKGGELKTRQFFNGKAISNAQDVIVVEGEKCVHQLQKILCIDGVAIVTSGGSGSFRADLYDQLKGKRVFVIPDNDEPGQKFADQIIAYLQTNGATVQSWRWDEAKEKGYDIADWLRDLCNDNGIVAYSGIKDVSSLFEVLEETEAGTVITNEAIKDVERKKLIDALMAGNKSENRRDPETFAPFPLDCLPFSIQGYIKDVAEALGQNEALPALAYLVRTGSNIGAAVRVKLGGSWFTVPIIWLVIVGISGFGKSPILTALERLTDDIDQRFYDDYQQKHKEYLLQYKDWERKRKKGEVAEEPIAPQRRKLFLTDATFEGLVKDCSASKCRTGLSFDEFVTFFSMSNRNGKPGEAQKWLAGYSGGKVETSRVTSKEVRIAHAYWALLGGSTPEKFRDYIQGTGGDKDGTLTRFNIIWAPTCPDSQKILNENETGYYSDDLNVIKRFRDAKAIAEALITYEPDQDVDNADGERRDYTLLHFSPEALILWNNRAKEYRRRSNGAYGEDTDAECGFISKSTELAPRIAIILHCINNAYQYVCSGTSEPMTLNKEISVNTYRKAEELANWIEAETQECYRRFGFAKDDEKGMKSKVYKFICNNNGKTKADIYKTGCTYFKPTYRRPELEKILNLLEAQGLIVRKLETRSNNKSSYYYYKADD